MTEVDVEARADVRGLVAGVRGRLRASVGERGVIPGGRRGASGKSRDTVIGPAEPSTADVALHDSGSNVASTLIVTVLFNCAPQTFAACWNAIRRCWPSVVPVLPPTGAAGVGSLKPTPAALPF